jgi:CRP-like cAMP-binding protein
MMFTTAAGSSVSEGVDPRDEPGSGTSGNPVQARGTTGTDHAPTAVTRVALALDRLAIPGAILQFDRDSEIIVQGQPPEYCFQVVGGCVRTVRLLEDGRRQVAEFLLGGDLFGWDIGPENSFAAEAVTPTTLRRIPLAAVEERAERDFVFARKLRQYAAGQVRAARSRLVMLGRKNASERIASFLLEMYDRLNHSISPSGLPVMDLPMSRADMADYLGLTIETVCRGLSELRRKGVIAVERTRVVILDASALADAGSDRLH